MRKIIATAAAAFIVVAAGSSWAATATHPCRADLDRLAADWQAISFPELTKPEQAHTYGAGGHDHTGGQISYMKQQIRLAYADCAAGREQAVRDRIAVVRSALRMPLNHAPSGT
ncbi:MAG: hypothetical protein P4L71_13485 [Acetobacteraceae bacterium]|nr:hypothetical protein [Acetobacteraceae bacterium]